jgi:Ca2+-binding RTX toxin-like protein
MPDLIYQPISATRYVVTIADVTDGTFDRAVIRGSGFTFDSETGAPLTGIVSRIDYGYQVPDPVQQFITSSRLSKLDVAVSALDTIGWIDWFQNADEFAPRLSGLPAGAVQEVRTYDGLFTNYFAYGGTGADILTGGLGFAAIYGGGGDDQISNLGGYQNELYGGDGNDRIEGGLTPDLIYGGDGDDRIIADDGTPVEVYEGDLIYGGAGQDKVFGGVGEDQIFGDAGNDLIHGRADRDFIQGGLGNDRLFGGDGDDFIQTEEDNPAAIGDLNLVYGGAGNDWLGATWGRDHVYGGDGNDFFLTNGAGTARDRLYGDDGDDSMNSGAGNDLVYGGAGNDTITGNGGDDRLFGGDGNDYLIAAFGDDRLTGGAGADVFVLYDAPGETSDNRITDFDVTLDRLAAVGPLQGSPVPTLTLEDFLQDAVQVRAHVIYTHPDGSVTRFLNLDLDDLTAANFGL